MEQEKEKGINIKVLGNYEESELDFQTRDDLPGFKEEGFDVYVREHIYRKKDGSFAERYYDVCTANGEWMSIKQLREILDKFEEEGATHVAMEHHCDHNGYMFDYGVLSVASDAEVEEYNNRNKEKLKEAKKEKIAELKKQIEELEG